MPKHYHVGSNVPGYLPDGDLTRQATAEDATACLGEDLVHWAEGEDNWTDEVENVARLGQELRERSSQKHQDAVHDVEHYGGFDFDMLERAAEICQDTHDAETFRHAALMVEGMSA